MDQITKLSQEDIVITQFNRTVHLVEICMKQLMKLLLVSACAFVLLVKMNFASANLATDTERLLNWAEVTFPQYFPTHQGTQSIEPWLFRYYPESQIYAGVNKSDNNVYVLGGAFGSTPTHIDSLANLMTQVNNSGGGSISGCDTSTVPAGISYSQSGNVVTVTTNDQCVPAPDLNNSNLCKPPKQTAPSGISLLGTNTVSSSQITGISVTGFPIDLKQIVDATANVKHCTKNAPVETANIIVNSNLCFDVTTAIASMIPPGTPGIVTNPPVLYSTKGTFTSQSVADCFATDASTVIDVFTGESWFRNKNGSFEKIQ